MLKITDMHCHILPGLDDGARDMEESMDAIRAAASQHVTAMIVTPHFYPGKYEPAPQQIREALVRVTEACSAEGIPMRFYPGQECMYHAELVDELESGRVLTMAGSSYVLVEFDPGCTWRYLHGALRELRSAGYVPILAHFERYPCLFEEGRAEQLKEEGFLIQMNFSRLLEKESFFKKSKWKKYVRDGIVDFLGSDSHGTHYRPYRIGETLDWLEHDLSEQRRKQILQKNIKKILNDA